MARFVKGIEALGIFGRFDIKQEFDEGINIIYGHNGAGKTTLLHILANALSGDYERFNFIIFDSIRIELSNEKVLQITRKKKNNHPYIEVKFDRKKIYSSPISSGQAEFLIHKANIDEEYGKLLPDVDEDVFEELVRIKKLRFSQVESEDQVSIAYFPAFRTMIEAWAAQGLKDEVNNRAVVRRGKQTSWKEYATKRARDWFGEFTPTVNFPSLVEIQEQLVDEIESARMKIWTTDQQLLSDAFSTIFSSLTGKASATTSSEKILSEIQKLFLELEKSPLISESRISFNTLQNQLANLSFGDRADDTAIRVLNVYKKALERTLEVQQKSFENLQKYQASVNEFLDGKELEFKTDIPRHRRQAVGIIFGGNEYAPGLRTLSSGERQIVTLVYASTHMSQQEIVLIDEPEISLHVDWQRKLIEKMAEQMGNRQIIACTHSPVIGANHLDKMKALSMSPTEHRLVGVINEIGEEEIPF